MTIIIAYSTRRFYEANPKLAGAVVTALDEAARTIAANKREAARLYNELAAVKAKEEDLMRILNDPDTDYSASPEGVMKYAEFLHRIGTIKNKPPDWKDLFFPPVHDKREAERANCVFRPVRVRGGPIRSPGCCPCAYPRAHVSC